MNLSSSSMEMNGALKEMRTLWEETKSVWNDGVRQSFDEHHWRPLESRVMAAMRAMERLAPILDKLQHDCGA